MIDLLNLPGMTTFKVNILDGPDPSTKEYLMSYELIDSSLDFSKERGVQEPVFEQNFEPVAEKEESVFDRVNLIDLVYDCLTPRQFLMFFAFGIFRQTDDDIAKEMGLTGEVVAHKLIEATIKRLRKRLAIFGDALGREPEALQ